MNFVRIVVAASFAALSFAAAARAEIADMVFLDGKVFTADARSSIAQAFAVKDGHFLAVGTSNDVRRFIGAGTKIIELHGRFVTPGLADAHFHNEGGGPGVDLSQTRSLDDVFAAIKAAAAKAKPGEIIVSNADWYEAQLREQRMPLPGELDAAAPDNPVVLFKGGHLIILSGSALKKWNITRDTVVPEGGGIGKGADGELNGQVFDNARQLVHLPPPPPVTIDEVIRTERTLNRYGITAVRIPGSYKGDLFADYKLMKQVHDAGQLTLRFIVYLPGFGTRDPAKIRDMIEGSGLKQDEGDDWLRIGGMKLLVDGGFEGGHMSQAYLEPYGKGGTFFGLTVVPTNDFIAVVRETHRLGWRVTTHVVGDAALEEVLDAYEAANLDRPIAGERWAIEHAFIARPELIARMKKLGLMLSVQDHLYLAAPVLKKYWGKERASEVSPLKTYLDAGFLLAGGTDSPVVPFNPFWELYHYLTRDTISDGVYGRDQRITSRPTLLRMVTINYAKLIGEEKTKGSIESGKLADFAVLSDDFLTVPAKKIPAMTALATYVGGTQVYADPSFSVARRQ